MEAENLELKELYEADLAERDKSASISEEELLLRDRKRRDQVRIIIEKGGLRTAGDYHHAALVCQHGEILGDYKLANDLARTAMEMGDERAKWLYAATLDRWLVSTGKPQKFGTQFKQDQDGQWHLIEPIDSETTDEERSKYNCPPLSEALAKFKEKYEIK